MSITVVSAGFVNRPGTRSATRPVTRSVTSTAPVRLTRRGRLLRSVLLAVALLVVLLVALVAWGPGVVATSGGGTPDQVRTVTVQPGQTLWTIAADSGLGGDPRDVVREIQDLNALTDPGTLQVGQTLAVPLH